MIKEEANRTYEGIIHPYGFPKEAENVLSWTLTVIMDVSSNRFLLIPVGEVVDWYRTRECQQQR